MKVLLNTGYCCSGDGCCLSWVVGRFSLRLRFDRSDVVNDVVPQFCNVLIGYAIALVQIRGPRMHCQTKYRISRRVFSIHFAELNLTCPIMEPQVASWWVNYAGSAIPILQTGLRRKSF